MLELIHAFHTDFFTGIKTTIVAPFQKQSVKCIFGMESIRADDPGFLGKKGHSHDSNGFWNNKSEKCYFWEVGIRMRSVRRFFMGTQEVGNFVAQNNF